jgi:TusA-related sulfurtransferase
MTEVAAIAVDGGDLALGGGLLALVRPALERLAPGGVLAILSRSNQVREDLPAWCKLEHHSYLGSDRIREGMDEGMDRHLIARGELSVPIGAREPNISLPTSEGRPTASDVLSAVPMPERADASSGFAPRGAQLEPGRPRYPFSLVERDHVAPPEVGLLYDQAVGAVWDATTDIPWSRIRPLPAAVEAALGQIMTFLAENELSALYLPSKFICRIHPAYAEVAMFLATQLADEARHIDVFLKRARVSGGVGISSATTSRSLLSLLELEDFTEAAFLLSVLGEGTFLDLLRFIERHAPDEVTVEIARRARVDETRHVHFGLAHVRHALAHDPTLYGRLEGAVRRRAAALHGTGGVPAAVQDALTILAARGVDPPSVARGHEHFRELLHSMNENRIKRLETAGFTADQAITISDLHTPNFM